MLTLCSKLLQVTRNHSVEISSQRSRLFQTFKASNNTDKPSSAEIEVIRVQLNNFEKLVSSKFDDLGSRVKKLEIEHPLTRRVNDLEKSGLRVFWAAAGLFLVASASGGFILKNTIEETSSSREKSSS